MIDRTMQFYFRDLADQKGYKYSAIADQTHINYSRLLRLFQGRTELLASELLKLAAFFHVDPLSMPSQNLHERSSSHERIADL